MPEKPQGPDEFESFKDEDHLVFPHELEQTLVVANEPSLKRDWLRPEEEAAWWDL